VPSRVPYESWDPFERALALLSTLLKHPLAFAEDAGSSARNPAGVLDILHPLLQQVCVGTREDPGKKNDGNEVLQPQAAGSLSRERVALLFGGGQNNGVLTSAKRKWVRLLPTTDYHQLLSTTEYHWLSTTGHYWLLSTGYYKLLTTTNY
jgi:hypothetical protein